MLITRIMPFISPLLVSNRNAITASQGAQFVNAVYPVSTSNLPLWQRVKIDPLVPVMIGVSVLRRIRPIDNLLKRIIRPGNHAPVSSPNNIPEPDFSIEIPDLSSANNALQGIAPGDTHALERVKGNFLNFGLSLLFLVLVLICMFITTTALRYLINSFNTQSKNLVHGTVELSEEIRSLPALMEDLEKNSKPVKKKTVSKRTKK